MPNSKVSYRAITRLAKSKHYNLGSSKWEWDNTLKDLRKLADAGKTIEEIEAVMISIDDSFTNEF